MTLAEEYELQSQWRNWPSYLTELPIKKTDTVLDMGCCTGQVIRLLAEPCLHVIGIDHNPELLQVVMPSSNMSSPKKITCEFSFEKVVMPH